MGVKSSTEYLTIQEYYGKKRAERSNVLLMDHINEGIFMLQKWVRPVIEQRAFAIHPLVQDHTAGHLSYLKSYPLAFEYSKAANSYLCRPDTDNLIDIYSVTGDISLGCAYMLLADKIQNQKDFNIYHLLSHPRSKELSKYFNNWIDYLVEYIHHYKG